MPKKSQTKKTEEASATRRFEWWKLALPLALGLLLAKPWEWQIFLSDPPRFELVKSITRPDSGLVIRARNEAANRNAPLDVEFSGLRFPSAALALPNTKPQQWRFDCLGLGLPDTSVQDGLHVLRVSFAGEAEMTTLRVLFSTQAPVVEAEITSSPERPQDRTLFGRVASKLQAPEETLRVEVAFHSQGRLVTSELPVERITDNNGVTFFEFETTVQGLPQIPPSDPRFSEPFFAFRVRDEAGNEYRQMESYAQFMAPGDKYFGVNKMADIEVHRHPADVKQITKVKFRFTPKPMTQLPNGKPPFELKVTATARNLNQLDWTNLPVNLRPEQPLSIVFRDEKLIRFTYGNRFEDKQASAKKTHNYRVEQEGSDGLRYSSPTVPAKPLPEPELAQAEKDSAAKAPLPQTKTELPGPRSSTSRTELPASSLRSSDTLSVEQVQSMLQQKNYFDSDWNKEGKGLTHQYEKRNLGGEQVVYDGATRLMWQQAGSTEYLTYAKAQEYIAALNAKGFAGYRDWRLPTLEEAMSLMEPKQYGGLYLDPLFDRKQWWIWTSDKYGTGRAWVVDFGYGYCGHGPVGSSLHVRAVR